jgi:hypothetical protein
MTEKRPARLTAALDTCENLLAPGRKWHVSPYIDSALREARAYDLAPLVPIYQSAFLGLLRGGYLGGDLYVLDLGSSGGIAAVATLDAMLAWETACSLYDAPSGINQVYIRPVAR